MDSPLVNMGPLTVICLSSICMMTPPNSNEAVREQIWNLRYLDKSVKLITEKLRYLNDTLRMKHERDLHGLLARATNDAAFNNTMTMHIVKEAVELASTQGRNSSHCYDIAHRILQDQTRSQFYNKQIPCITTFILTVNNVLDQVKPIAEALSKLQTRLDVALRYCHSDSDSAECLDANWFSMEYEYDRLEQLFDSLDYMGQSEYKTWLYNYDECLFEPAKTLVKISNDVERDGVQCAKSTGDPIKN